MAVSLNASDNNALEDYMKVESTYTITSSNHFEPVSVVSTYNNNILVTASRGGKSNLKIWKISEYNMTMIDDRSLAYFTVMKSGYM